MMAIGVIIWRVFIVGVVFILIGGGDGGQELGEVWFLLLLQLGLRGFEFSVSLFYQFGFKVYIYFFLQFGRIEVIDNTFNFDFVRKFIVDYFFEEKQNFRFDL